MENSLRLGWSGDETVKQRGEGWEGAGVMENET